MRRALWLLAAVVFVSQASGGEIVGKALKLGNTKHSAQVLEYPLAGTRPVPAVIVVHGDFGLTPWVQQQCSRLARKGYYVVALDLYSGKLPKDVEEAHILERGLEDDRVHAQLKEVIDYLAGLKGVRQDAIHILGWDMGGGYALDAAVRDKRLRSAVNCYGRLTTDAKQLANLEAKLLCLFAGKDEGIGKDTIAQFEAALKKAGKTATLHTYPDSNTGFMDPGSPYQEGRPDAAVIADAWRRIEEHLAK